MITLNDKFVRDIQEAVRLAREAITSMKAADVEARHDDRRDGTAVFEELYGDEQVDPRTVTRNWHDAQDKARQARQKLEDMEFSARWDVDDVVYVLTQLEDAVKDSDPELHKDLQWARSRTFQPDMDEESFYWDFERRLERLIEFLEDLTKPEERQSRVQLIAWTQEKGMTPWGKTNKQLRQGIDHACFFTS